MALSFRKLQSFRPGFVRDRSPKMPSMDRRTLLVSGLALAAGVPAAAENARRFRILEDDSRLDARVTLRLKRAPLSDVATALAQQTAVRMRAPAETADEPAFVYVDAQPARDVMRQLALLFNFQWRRTGAPGRYRYEIYQDTASRREEERLRERDRRRAIEALREEIRLALDLLKRPPEDVLPELRARQEAAEHHARDAIVGDPGARPPRVEQELRRAEIRRLTAAAGPGERAMLLLAGSLSAAQWDALVDDGRIVFSTREESEAWPMPAAVARALASQAPGSRQPGAPATGSPEEEESARRMDRSLQDAWSRAQGFRAYCRLTLAAGQFRSWLPRAQISVNAGAIVPDRETTVRFGGILFTTSSEGTEVSPDPEIAPEEGEKDAVLAARARWRLDPGRFPPRDWFTGWLTRSLPSLAESYHLNLVADAYLTQRADPPSHSADAEVPLYVALNRCFLPAARCTRDGAFLRIRRHRWYDVRLGEIPDHVAATWANLLRQRDRLTLDELAGLLLAFRDEQVDENFEAVMEDRRIALPELFDSLSDQRQEGLRPVLRTYAGLPPELRRRLLAGEILSLAALPPDRRAQLRKIASRTFLELPPPSKQLDAGALQLGSWDVERGVEVGDDGTKVTYRFLDASSLPTEKGEPLFFSGYATQLLFAPDTDPVPMGGQRTQLVRVRYLYAPDQGVNWIVILPWVRVLPPPPAEPNPAARPGSR